MTNKTKVCPGCMERKTYSHFKQLKRNYQHGIKKALDDGTGFSIECIPCKKRKSVEAQRKWREDNRELLIQQRKDAKRAREAELVARLKPTDGIPWRATLGFPVGR